MSPALYGTSLKFRGPDYLSARLALERPRAFILHDVRDRTMWPGPLLGIGPARMFSMVSQLLTEQRQ